MNADHQGDRDEGQDTDAAHAHRGPLVRLYRKAGVTMAPAQLITLDHVVHRRLRRLARMPVDAQRLELHLQRLLGDAAAREPWVRRRWMPAVSGAVAAALAIAAIVGFSLLTDNAALATPAQVAGVHQKMIAGELPHATGDAKLRIPTEAEAHLVSRCRTTVAGRATEAVLLDWRGVRVSMHIASRDQLRMPSGQTVLREGRAYTVHEAGGVTMVMTERAGRWLCTAGDVSADRLIELLQVIEIAAK